MKNLNVSIIIQGPTSYYKEILDAYSNYSKVLWCTWKDEPSTNIKAIEKSGIVVHLIEKPNISGNSNINLQCKSTYEGLLKCNELFQTDYYIKIRSDFRISNISLLCQRFIKKKSDLNFLGWANIDGGFILDYIVFGDFENMKKFWKFEDIADQGNPCPEIFLMKRFFGNEISISDLQRLSVKMSPSINNIDIQWLSRNKEIKSFLSFLLLNCKESKWFYKFKIKIYIWLKGKFLRKFLYYTDCFFKHYVPNNIVSKIPFYSIRHLYYKKILQIKIGTGTSIHMGVFFFHSNLDIGCNTCINRNIHLDCRGGILIGNNVSISPECTLITGSHDYNSKGFDYISHKITIADYVWIGTRSIILPNVEIGEGAVVCAGSVVTKNVAPYSVVAGVPAKEIGLRSNNLSYHCNWFMPFD